MGPAMTAQERAAAWPHLTDPQRCELERWHRARAHAWMTGEPVPTDPQPWPAAPDA
jgi:hypothetical protein